ncbi:carbohydrate ABC transporter substrate-binding protein (CUT1 family) [Pseudokineococcus lusitanus]|uniref:Carbohydrate ABC transporter substrate-binding protein (CUT1 family) n=1 Tax=Pseudokineococcus lusitanus TaxID=763993 RepID=A0A3N1GWA2_9ACTN|nr:carbohydrate ABC transporter substrate-binding protein (CUT1 family) [Pseudokineococcus lusitanus]
MALLTTGLAACGGGDDAGGDGGEVTSLVVQDTFVTDPGATFYGEQLDACGEELGITVDRQSVPGDSIISRVLQQASSQTLPDVLSIDNPDVQQLAAAGALAPLDDLGVSAEGYSEGVVAANSYEGSLYGLQPTTNTLALFYDPAALEAAGVEVPTTWDELRTASAALTEGSRYGLAFSAPPSYEGTWQFLPFMWSNGGDEADIATPEVAEALQLWTDIVEEGSASASVVSWGQEDVNDQFIAGNAAMMINGPWQFPVLAENPDVEYEVAPLPVPAAGEDVVAPLGGATWTVPETGDAARQQVAADLVSCLNEDERVVEDALTNSTVPTKAALGDQIAEADPRMQAFVDAVPTLRSRTGELGADWTDAATAIYTAVQTSLTGGAAPEQALEQAQGR